MVCARYVSPAHIYDEGYNFIYIILEFCVL